MRDDQRHLENLFSTSVKPTRRDAGYTIPHPDNAVVMIADRNSVAAEALGSLLTQAGFQPLLAPDSQTIHAQLRNKPISAILLDFHLQQNHRVIERCDLLTRSHPPVILLIPAEQAAQLSESPLLYAAHDFVSKPFLPQDLLTRLRRAIWHPRLRATSENRGNSSVIPRNIRLNVEQRQVIIGVERVALTPNECQLLKVLLRKTGEIVGKDELVQAVWSGRFYNDENVLRVTIRRLRTKIEPNPSQPMLVETVYGKGYRLSSEVPKPPLQ
jgi:two-component system response regulator RegX3